MVGLVASAPNEYWHADTTYYYISDIRKVCITVVMDNFSKMVLGFAVNEKLCFTLIKEALIAALEVDTDKKGENNTMLVTDFGKENHNGQVYQFLSTLRDYQLTSITALKDIQFSNSPVEAIHRILKSRYLRNRKFTSVDELTAFLHEAILNYNTKRPHCRHGLRTPAEVYHSISLPFNPKEKLLSAIKGRIQRNRNTSCQACLPVLPCDFE